MAFLLALLVVTGAIVALIAGLILALPAIVRAITPILLVALTVVRSVVALLIAGLVLSRSFVAAIIAEGFTALLSAVAVLPGLIPGPWSLVPALVPTLTLISAARALIRSAIIAAFFTSVLLL